MLYHQSWSGVYKPAAMTRALAVSLPRQDHVEISTKPSIRFHKNEFDGMLCKLDFAEYARSFEPNPTLP